MKKSVTLLLLVILFPFAVFAQESPSEGDLLISGASTIQPAAEQVAELYRQRYEGNAEVKGGGSGAGIRDVVSGTSDIGMVSRGLSPAELESVTPVLIAFDALVFIVNKTNPLENISKPQIVELFSGSLRSWAQINGQDAPVVLISKEQGRATLDLFEGYSGLHHPDRTEEGPAGKIDSRVLEIASNLECITLVGGIPNAIGYVSLGAAELMVSNGMPIKILPLEGVYPSSEKLLSREYPILRELNLIIRETSEEIERFIELFFEEDMKQFLKNSGFIPIQRETR